MNPLWHPSTYFQPEPHPVKKLFMGLAWELTVYNSPTQEMPRVGRQRLPLKKLRVQTTV